MGIPQKSILTPHDMAQIRAEELKNAAGFLNASYKILSFPDLHLPFVPFELLVKSVLPIVRSENIDSIFSFHPNEFTRKFDHPDHNIAGQLARYVGAAADVKNFMPEHKVLSSRPNLYLWTSENSLATHSMKLNKSVRKSRDEYLMENYPSQFSIQNYLVWKKIFAKITESKDGHVERYQKVR